MEEGRRHDHRRTGSGRCFRPGAGCGAGRGTAPVRLSLSLCAGDAPGRGCPGDMVRLHDGRWAVSLPLLSLVTFVPLLGVLAILAMPTANNARWIALGTTIVTFALSLCIW